MTRLRRPALPVAALPVSVTRSRFANHDRRAWLALLLLFLAAGCGAGEDPGAVDTGPNRSDLERPDGEQPAGETTADNEGRRPNELPPPADDPFSFKGCNVVFVSFDALQASHVGCLGYERPVTPTVDTVAERGFVFRNNTSVASWTVPSSMTWFTGVYPSEHRMVNKYAVYQPPVRKLADLRELSPDLVTLADVFKANGYATGGFTGNAGVSGGFGYEQGFDEYYYEKGKFGRLTQSVPKALAWLREHRDERFFLFLHGYDVHGQSLPIGGFDYRFVDEGYDRRYTGAELEQEVLREEGLVKGQLTLRDEDVRFWRAVYDEKVQRADEQFRIFLAEFDRLGLRENTVFVLTSDHGTELYEHRRFDHGFTLYQELIHTPLIVALPPRTNGKDAGTAGEPARTMTGSIEDRVSSLDIMPTILDLLDVDVPEKVRGQLRGTSLVPALRGEPVRRAVFSETDYREYTYKRCIIDEQGWKLVYTLENDTRELYDLGSDPHERKDVAEDEPERADALQKRLFDHFASIGHDLTKRTWKVGLNPVYPSQGQ